MILSVGLGALGLGFWGLEFSGLGLGLKDLKAQGVGFKVSLPPAKIHPRQYIVNLTSTKGWFERRRLRHCEAGLGLKHQDCGLASPKTLHPKPLTQSPKP